MHFHSDKSARGDKQCKKRFFLDLLITRFPRQKCIQSIKRIFVSSSLAAIYREKAFVSLSLARTFSLHDLCAAREKEKAAMLEGKKEVVDGIEKENIDPFRVFSSELSLFQRSTHALFSLNPLSLSLPPLSLSFSLSSFTIPL